jgi:O-antigen ligase
MDSGAQGIMLTVLVYVAIGLLPLANLLRIDVGLGVAVLPLDWVVGLIALVALPYHVRNWSVLRKDRVFQCAAVFVGLGLLSLVMNLSWLAPLSASVSLLYLIRFVVYAQLLWVVGYVPADSRPNVLKGLALAGLTSVVAGILQYFFYSDLRNLYYAGWDEHIFRIFGAFLDPNFTGAFFLCTLAMLSMLKKHKLLYTSILRPIIWAQAGIACAIALTYSRSSYVALLVYASLNALLQKNRRLFATIVIGFFAVLAILSTNRAHESVNLFRTASIQARITEYQQAQEIIADSPLLGVGFNAYRYAQLRHGFLDFESWQRDHAGAGVPNSWLFVLATTGIFGFIAYLGMWLHMGRRLLKQKDHTLLALLGGLGVHAMFENTLFYPYLMFTIFLLYSWTQAFSGKRRTSDE